MSDRVANDRSAPSILERLARLEAGQDWIRIMLGLLGAFMIGGFAFLGVQISRIDGKVDALGSRMSGKIGRLDGKIDALGSRMSGEIGRLDGKIDAVGNRLDSKIDAKFDILNARIAAEGERTRQELVGIATAIANSITASRQFQPQLLPVPTPVPGPKESGPSQPPAQP